MDKPFLCSLISIFRGLVFDLFDIIIHPDTVVLKFFPAILGRNGRSGHSFFQYGAAVLYVGFVP